MDNCVEVHCTDMVDDKGRVLYPVSRNIGMIIPPEVEHELLVGGIHLPIIQIPANKEGETIEFNI